MLGGEVVGAVGVEGRCSGSAGSFAGVEWRAAAAVADALFALVHGKGRDHVRGVRKDEGMRMGGTRGREV